MIWGSTSNYNDGPDGIRREKRMSEWQRSMMLSPQQREMVQARMIADPYDNESSTRLERINEQVNADPYRTKDQSSAYREAIAARLYNQPQSYSSNGQQDDGYARAQRSAQRSQAEDPSSQFTVGEINGRRVVAPQAGHYNAYQNVMGRLGLGDSPSPEAFSYAMEQQRIDPNKRYESDQDTYRTALKAQGDQRKQHDINESRNARQRLAEDKVFSADRRKGQESLAKMGQYDGYREMQKRYAAAINARGTSQMSPEEFTAYLDSQGVQYERGTTDSKFPMIVPRGRFKADRFNPERQQQVEQELSAIAQTPGGLDAYGNHFKVPQMVQGMAGAPGAGVVGQGRAPQPQMRQAQPAMGASQQGSAMQAPQAPMAPQAGGGDEQKIQTAIQHFTTTLGPEKGMQELMRRASRNPQAMAQLNAYLQKHGDRILATQVGR